MVRLLYECRIVLESTDEKFSKIELERLERDVRLWVDGPASPLRLLGRVCCLELFQVCDECDKWIEQCSCKPCEICNEKVKERYKFVDCDDDCGYREELMLCGTCFDSAVATERKQA